MYDRRRLALSLIAIVSNAAYTTIAPILPLEVDKHGISESYISLIFLSFSIGSSISPIFAARYFESIGTTKVMVYAMTMMGMSFNFWCIGYVFTTSNDQTIVVGLLTFLQFFMGAFFSVITTGYYSLATLLFAEKESTNIMSYIEASVGIGYILGPIISSLIYDEFGYQSTFGTFISLAMMLMAFVTWRYLASHLRYKVSEDDSNIIDTDVEAHTPLNITHGSSYNSLDASNRNHSHEYLNIQDTREDSLQHYPTTLSLLKFRTILIGASSILWINVSWTAIEPLLAKRLDSLHVGKKGIGIIFSLSSIIYVPSVFLVQYLPRHVLTISLSIMLTPIAVLLTGVKSLPSVLVGIILLGILPTPVWVQLLPWIQEESTILFPDTKRHLNDTIASIYNSSMTLGQLVGYTIGPLMSSYGFTRMTQIVACLIFLQSMLFYFGTKYSRRRKDASRTSSNLSNKQII